jgi:hypothetical protein
LKDPPAGYFHPPFDVIGHLASIRQKLVDDAYPNEIKFQEDLVGMFGPAHDGHFAFYPDALSVLSFGRQAELVSYAENQTSLPIIKMLDDVNALGDRAMAVTRINRIEASRFVDDMANGVSGFHDPDAAYNSLFFSQAKAGTDGPQTSGYFSFGGRHRFAGLRGSGIAYV